MATYPATNSKEASELLIDGSNQVHEVVNGDATTEVTTESGPIPSLRKAISDTFLFQDPLAWQNGSNETAFNQLRTFDNNLYWAPTATLSTPIPMGTTPIGDSNWKLAPVDINREWTLGEITTAQNDIVGGSIFKGSNGETIQDGDFVEAGTTHLRVLVDGKPTIVAISPVASGAVSLLTENGATIGGIQVSFLKEIYIPSLIQVNGGMSLEYFTEKAYVTKTVTVGAAGDYQTINDAINDNARLKPIVNGVRRLIEINLLSGFVMSEQVIVFNTDLSHFIITSQDAEVIIDRSSLADPRLSYLAKSNFPAFGIMECSKGPIIDVLFSMDSSGSATNRTGVLVNQDSFIQIMPGKGVKNAGFRGLHVSFSKALANGANFENPGDISLRVGNLSTVWADSFIGHNAGNAGISVDTLAKAYVRNANFDGAGNINVNIAPGAFAEFSYGFARNGTVGIENSGGEIVFEGAKITGNSSNNLKFVDGSKGNGKLSDFSGCTGGDNALVANASVVDLHSSNGSGSLAGNGLNAQSGSVVDLTGSDMTGNALVGVQSIQLAKVTARQVDASGSLGVSDVRVFEGGLVEFHGGAGNTNIAVNTLTTNGIIFG